MSAQAILERAHVTRPTNWDDMGSSARDLWEERQLRSLAKQKTALGVWMLFDAEDDEEPSHEANVFLTDDQQFSAEWYNTGVGLVTARTFPTFEGAVKWLEDSGYTDYSS